jgi:chromosome segregation ATPase
MTGDELAATLRTLIREEINAALYASEVRLREEITASEQHLGKRLDGIEERLHRAEDLQMRMGTNLAKMGTVLEEATIKINELQMSFIALDQKVDGIKREIQQLFYRADTAEEAISGLSHRLKLHQDTPINEAHPHAAA